MTDIMILPTGDRSGETSPLREWANTLAGRFRDAVSGALLKTGKGHPGNEGPDGLPDCMRDAGLARAEWLKAVAGMRSLEQEMEERAEKLPAARLPLAHTVMWALLASAISLAGLIGAAGIPPLIAMFAVLVNAQGAMAGGRLTRQAFAAVWNGGWLGRAASACAAHGAGLLGAIIIAFLSARMETRLLSPLFLAAPHLVMAAISWRRALPDSRLEWLLEKWKELDRAARKAARDYHGRLEAARVILDDHMEELHELEHDVPENAPAGMG